LAYPKQQNLPEKKCSSCLTVRPYTEFPKAGTTGRRWTGLDGCKRHSVCNLCNQTDRALGDPRDRTARTRSRAESRLQEKADWGLTVYAHVDPLTYETVYVGSGDILRARSCRKGGGFQRTDDHANWYKWHRRNGSIQTHHDFCHILHHSLLSQAEALRLEGEETIKALRQGARLFNRELPNPVVRSFVAKDMIRHSVQAEQQ